MVELRRVIVVNVDYGLYSRPFEYSVFGCQILVFLHLIVEITQFFEGSLMNIEDNLFRDIHLYVLAVELAGVYWQRNLSYLLFTLRFILVNCS